MLLMRANYEGKREGLDPGHRYIFGPCEKASGRQASAIWGPKTSRFSGPNPLPLAQVMDMSASKIITHRNL